jgi:hypothetical protein
MTRTAGGESSRAPAVPWTAPTSRRKFWVHLDLYFRSARVGPAWYCEKESAWASPNNSVEEKLAAVSFVVVEVVSVAVALVLAQQSEVRPGYRSCNRSQSTVGE